MLKRMIWLVALLGIIILPSAEIDARGGDYQPGELLIGFVPNVPSSAQERILARLGARVVKRFGYINALLVMVTPGEEMAQAAAIQDDPAILWAEPNYHVHAAAVPNDPDFPSHQWNLRIVDAPAAWDAIRDAQDVLIAVVDTGVDYEHPDLRGSRWLNPAESVYNPWLGRYICDRDGIDDDANGYVDDCYGWDWVDYDAAPMDGNGHGTRVAGIAAAATDNGIGIAGMGWGARFMALRVLDRNGQGDIANLLSALHYLGPFASHRHIVVNLSLSLSPGTSSQTLRSAVEWAQEQGMLLVAASGNEGLGRLNEPAAYPDVLAVGATDAADERWEKSNFGQGLDVVAPGVDIYAPTLGFSYNQDTGTSFATPHVSGLAALLWSAVPDLTADEVAGIIRETANDVNADTRPGPDDHIGWGRINARKAAQDAISGLTLTLTADPPGIPVGGRTTVTGTVIGQSGVPEGTGVVVQFRASNGVISPTATVSQDGIVTATFTAGPVTGTGIITATLGEGAEEIAIPISTGDPYTISLSAVPSLVAVGGGDQGRAQLRARVTDAAGNAARDGITVTFTATLGAIMPITSTTEDGVALSTLISGDQEGTAHVTATVGALVAGTEVKIAGPGQPFSITLTATPSSVPVGEQSIITATLYDANGFRVAAGHPISFHVASGSIIPETAQTDANGQAAAVFTAGGELGVTLVEAQAGLGLYASVAITVTPGEPYTVTVAAASPQV
ncbi:MAG: S8 family serine peptidase, partial [Anaerolineae bacterium]|nr:S8 family serine peptidase [Anaerolineae bacterium]